MNVVILAGGLGTRLAGETEAGQKPMAEIGEHPVPWHLMKGFREQGLTGFLIRRATGLRDQGLATT